MEFLQIGVITHFQATPLFSMKTELLALSQSCFSIDADAQCKQTLTVIWLSMTTKFSFRAAWIQGLVIWMVNQQFVVINII